MNEAPRLAGMLRAIATGATVDPESLETTPSDVSTAFLIEELKILGRIAEVHGNARRDAATETDDETPDNWGPLTILECVGRGSYGDVYRAWDTRLDREVALKLLRHRVDEDSSPVIEEGRLLARVRHPNAITVYGADRIDGRVGVWMEFVEGRTLEEDLQARGPLPAAEVAAIGVDICRALAAVHNADVVHGDVKAQNVMREAGGRIVLMDFGSGLAAGSDEATVGGTPLYLAPEVLAGEAATPRSDIYAVGVLLYHLLTGAYPIEAATLADVRAAHEGGRRTSVRTRRLDVPRRLTEVIERAIAVDPADRYDDAPLLAAALSAAMKPRVSRVTAAAALLAIAAGVGVISLWRDRGVPAYAPSQPRWILVSAFENHTADPRLDDALRTALEHELMQSADLGIVMRDRIDDALRLMRRGPVTRLDAATAREVAVRDAGINLVATPRIASVGAAYTLAVTVDDVRQKVRVFDAGETARGPDELLAAVAKLAAGIRTAVSRHPPPSGGALPPVSTASLEALIAYSRGIDLCYESKWAAAELPLREAVRIDRDFASAYILLAWAIRNQRRDDDEYRQLAARAVTLSEKLPSRERHFIVGSYHHVHDRLSEAAAAYEALVREYPNDFWGVNNLINVYALSGRHRESTALAAIRADQRPNHFISQVSAAQRFVAFGELSRADRFVERATALVASIPPDTDVADGVAWLRFLPAFKLWTAGRLPDAIAALPRLSQTVAHDGSADPTYAAAGLLELTFGRVKAAEAWFTRMSATSQRYSLLGYAALARGDRQTAIARLRADPRHFDGSPMATPAAGFQRWAMIIQAAMLRAGMINEAEMFTRTIERLSRRLRSEFWEGQLAAGRGDRQTALKLLEGVVALRDVGHPMTPLAVNTLADLYVETGDFRKAEELLRQFESRQVGVYSADGSRGFEWLQMRARLASVQRRLGDHAAADATERELRELLQYADADFVVRATIARSK